MDQADVTEAKAKDDDEISLIDIFIVLLRQRKIIIGITAVAVLIAVAYFYAAPAVGLRPRYSYSVDASFVPVQFPPSIKTEIGIDIPNYAKMIATAPGNLVAPVWAMGLAVTKTMSGPEDTDFRTFLIKEFIGKKYSCTIDKDGALRLSIQDKDRAVAETFLKSVVALTDQTLRQEVSKRARVIADSMDTLIAETEKKGLAVSVEARQMLLSSRNFMNENTTLLQTVSDLQVSRIKNGRSTGAIVTVLAGFFLSILAAFIAEAIANVRKDEEALYCYHSMT
jgi:capsular polysaccharide biosynthesis protein